MRPRPAGRDRFVYGRYRLGAAALRALPRRLTLPLGAAVARLAAHASPERRAVVADNLRHVLGAVPDAQLEATVRDAFAAYGRYWADVATLRPGDLSHLDRLFRVRGQEHVDQARAKGGVILAVPHLGSWEIGGLWARSGGFHLVTVAEPIEPAALFDWFVRERARLGLTVHPVGAMASRTLLEELRDGGVVALVADRDVVGDGIAVQLFGATTRVPAGPAVLALRTGATLLPCAIYLDANGHHDAVVLAPIDTTRHGALRDDVARITQALARAFEELIAAAPEQWHVFQPNFDADANDDAADSRVAP